MTRKECLEQAMGCVLRDRNNEYGGPEDSFGVIANFWSVYLGRKVYPADVAMMMSLLKIARIKGNRGYKDGYIDLAGYAACGAECASGDHVSAHKADEEPRFKHGDRVQYRVELPSVSDWIWRDATYLRPAFSWQQDGEHIVSSDDLGPVTVKDKDIRPAPKPKAREDAVREAGEEHRNLSVKLGERLYNPGDRVQVWVPTANGDRWDDAVCVSVLPEGTGIRVDYGEHKGIAFGWPFVRHAPKAEGCEDLVQKDALIQPDAPQTPEETCQRIVDSNPATFHTPSYAEEQLEHHSRLQARTPTGEELAEMAEEVPDGH